MKKYLVFSLILGLVSPLTIFAQTNVTTVPPVVTATPAPATYNGVCASNAVIAHENTLQTIVETKQASIKVATIARRDALGVAYLLTDFNARFTAIKATQDNFITAQDAASKIALDALTAENNSFGTIMQACGATVLPLDQTGNQNSSDNSNNQAGLKMGLNNIFSRTLMRGMRGEDVKKIQKVLGLTEDGVFGPMTESKIKDWQSQKGLTEDGILGKQSLGEMETEIESEDSGSNNNTNQSGDNNQGNTNVNNSDNATGNTSGDN